MRINYELCFLTPQKKWIYVPTEESRNEGSRIIESLIKKWEPPNFYYHFQKGGHVSAIRQHVGNKYFAKLDIQNFFPNISKAKVIRSLKLIGFNYKKAETIAEWSTVKCKETNTKIILPFGFVQSQHMASICLDASILGKYLKEIYERKSINLSVYVDDFLMSSNDRVMLDSVYHELRKKMVQAHFKINELKSHAAKEETVSFNILCEDRKCEIEKARFEDFKKSISQANLKRSKAIIGYVKSVNAVQALELENLLKTTRNIT